MFWFENNNQALIGPMDKSCDKNSALQLTDRQFKHDWFLESNLSKNKKTTKLKDNTRKIDTCNASNKYV